MNTMAISRETTGCKVEVEGHNVDNVREAVYLGLKFSEDEKIEGEKDWDRNEHKSIWKQRFEKLRCQCIMR